MEHPLRVIIRHFDSWLSQQNNVVPFNDDPDCILRIQIQETRHPLELSDGTLPAGTEVIMLHLWNERSLHIPTGGPDISWGLKMYRLTRQSLRFVARFIVTHESLGSVQAIGGITPHFWLDDKGGIAMLNGLGFSTTPYHSRLGAFGEFWENFYSWWLMWTFNPVSSQHRSMFNLQRSEFWTSKESFLERYSLPNH